MTDTDQSHRNNFGLLRLAFAMCVLVSHSIELLDGNRSREPLTYLFGTLSLGELGVDGFFLVSGYLITQSFENSTSVFAYLWKRILRIYPAFIVAFSLSIIVVGPLSGADMSALSGVGWLKQVVRMFLLRVPVLPEAFAGLHYPALNASMWTIPHEFRCYLLVAALGFLGLLQRKIMFGIGLFSLFLFVAFYPFKGSGPDSLGDSLRLITLFFFGSAFYLFREIIPYRNKVALIVAFVLIAALFNRTTELLATPTLAGYLIFWFAFLENTPRLNRINVARDLSYGIYLYAWPVQSLLIKFIPSISPITVIALTTAAASALALLSWHLIEKPSLALKRVGRRAVELQRSDNI